MSNLLAFHKDFNLFKSRKDVSFVRASVNAWMLIVVCILLFTINNKPKNIITVNYRAHVFNFLYAFHSICHVMSYLYSDKNSSSNMKIDTLSFLNTLLVHHNPTVFHPHMKILVPVSVFYFQGR